MQFEDLKGFILSKMRMSHIYQPVMIKSLLESEDPLSPSEIAKSFLLYDISQIEYYEQITKNMPGRVLSRHGVVQREDNNYSLTIDIESLSDEQRHELINLCNKKIDEYIERRGSRIWQHRKLGDRVIPGSIRYQVLKRAGYRCELCGVSAEERALEVDHIVPHNWQGPDTIDNYQALCYKCNANKRDTDSTDFRDWKNIYDTREEGCIFCYPDMPRLVEETELAYVLRDGFPVTEGHLLMIPKRHVSSYFELFVPEINACNRLLQEYQKKLQNEDPSIQGFNIGVNVNEAAGQTIMHCHIHLIPRREGDVENPRGGIRHLIPGKGNYPANHV